MSDFNIKDVDEIHSLLLKMYGLSLGDWKKVHCKDAINVCIRAALINLQQADKFITERD